MKKNLMITFSGIDSSGKSTYIDLTKKLLDELDIRYKVVWSRGGYTNFFEKIKKLLRFIARKKLPESGHSNRREELFRNAFISSVWYVISMVDLICLYWISFNIYKKKDIVLICDRYLWDTYVDFSIRFTEKNMNKSLLWAIACRVSRKPDLSFYFFVSPELSLSRSLNKNEAFSETLEQRKVRLDLYSKLQNNDVWRTKICTDDDIENVWNRVKGVIIDALY